MKINELIDKWTYPCLTPPLMGHPKAKTVHFWPTSFDETDTHYIFNGWWICLQVNEPIVQERIKMKKEDLESWFIVKE